MRLATAMLIAAALVASLAPPALAQGEQQPPGDGRPQGHQVRFQVPEGVRGLRYSPAVPEQMRWGPKALAQALDSTFWIANTYGDDLLHYTGTGILLGSVKLDGVATGITDLEATDAGLFALDAAAPVPSVLHLSHTGALLARRAIPSELRRLVTGLRTGEGGELLLEHKTRVVYRLLDGAGNPSGAYIAGLTVGGNTLQVRPSTATAPSRGGITVGATTIPISVPRNLAGVRVLGVRDASSFYAIVDELAVDGTTGAFKLDEVVHHYAADGRLLGMARFPLAEQHVRVDHPYAISRDGSVYALLTRPEGGQIVQLNFAPSLPPVLGPARGSDARAVGATVSDGVASATACRITRATVATNAWAYVNNRKYLSSSATDGPCPGRGKPRHIQGAGTYGSVPYDWGGGDSVAGYNGYVDAGYQAGDVPSEDSTVESCSRGVDCSGLITRVWGVSAKRYSTHTLPEISFRLHGPWSLKRGDIVNKAGAHVRLINWVDGNGAAFWEATTNGHRDRVVYRYVPWADMARFQPRRYTGICDP